MAKKGLDVKIISHCDKKNDIFSHPNIQIIDWKIDRGSLNFLKEFRSFLELFKIIKNENPDIVHNFTIKANIYGSISAKLLGIKKIINTITGLGYTYTDDRITSYLPRTFIKLIWIFALNFSDFVIFMNFKDKLIIGRYLIKRKSLVIPGHGINQRYWSRKKSNKAIVNKLKKKLNIGKNDIVITTVGRLIKHKGMLEFAKAAEILNKENSFLKFIMVGATDNQNPTRILENELKTINQSGVTILKNRNDVREILYLSNIFVLASYKEAVPQVIIEAMSMELPIITTDVAGCNERVIVGKNGYLARVKDHIDIAKKIKLLLKDVKKRQTMGRYSRFLVEHNYAKEKMTNIINSYYD